MHGHRLSALRDTMLYHTTTQSCLLCYSPETCMAENWRSRPTE